MAAIVSHGGGLALEPPPASQTHIVDTGPHASRRRENAMVSPLRTARPKTTARRLWTDGASGNHDAVQGCDAAGPILQCFCRATVACPRHPL